MNIQSINNNYQTPSFTGKIKVDQKLPKQIVSAVEDNAFLQNLATRYDVVILSKVQKQYGTDKFKLSVFLNKKADLDIDDVKKQAVKVNFIDKLRCLFSKQDDLTNSISRTHFHSPDTLAERIGALGGVVAPKQRSRL